MKFYYNVVETRCVEINFQEIYNYIRDNEPDMSNHYDIYLAFIDNCYYYLDKLYKLEDFIGEDNDFVIQELIDSWGAWLEETFGENWDEI